MLGTIREKTQGWFTAIILGLLAIPFALWGVNYYFEGGQLNVASVDGHDISVDSYKRAVDDQRRRLPDPKLLDSPELRQVILDNLINDYLVAREAQGAGYRISDAELARQIRQLPWFQRDGQFDVKAYEVALRSQGKTPREYEQTLRQRYLIEQARSGYANTALITDADVAALLRYEGQQRDVEYAVVSPAKLREAVRVSVADIEQEYQRAPERYRTPEKVRIEFVRLNATDLAKAVQLTDEELRQALSEAAQAGQGAEERRASHILLELPQGADAAAEKAAMKQAKDLRAKILAGSDFATLAKQHSKDPGSAAQGGDLGAVARGTMVKEFEAALFAMKKAGEVSEPVRTSFGLHLIKLTGLKAATPAKVDRARVEASLKARKAEERFIDLAERLRNLAYEQPDSLRPAAEALGLKIETSDWFSRAGSKDGLTANRKVIEAAFNPEVLEQRRNSDALEIGPNQLVVVRLHAHEPPRQRPLAEVRAAIEQELLANARRTEGEKIANAALQQAREGKPFEAVARQNGLTVTAVRTYGRTSAGVDAGLLQAAFAAASPAGDRPSLGVVGLADGSYAVYAVRKLREPATVDLKSKEAQAIRRALEARRGRDYYEGYKTGLRQQVTIKIHKDQL
jgi:peptidyl-prolyl cis-trans isomerase D